MTTGLPSCDEFLNSSDCEWAQDPGSPDISAVSSVPSEEPWANPASGNAYQAGEVGGWALGPPKNGSPCTRHPHGDLQVLENTEWFIRMGVGREVLSRAQPQSQAMLLMKGALLPNFPGMAKASRELTETCRESVDVGHGVIVGIQPFGIDFSTRERKDGRGSHGGQGKDPKHSVELVG